MLFLFLAAAQFASSIFSWPEGGQLTFYVNMGDGLKLQTIAPDDFEAFNRLRSDASVTKFMAGGAKTEAQNREWFNTLIKRTKDNNPTAWLTLKDATNTIIGFVALGILPKYAGVGQVVRILDSTAQGKRLGTRITQYLLAVIGPEVRRLGLAGVPGFQCFEGKTLKIIYSTQDPQNQASWKSWRNMISVGPSFIENKLGLTGSSVKPITIGGITHALTEKFGAERYCVEYTVPNIQGFMPLVTRSPTKSMTAEPDTPGYSSQPW